MKESQESIRKEHEESWVRKLLDSPFILLVLSLVIVLVSYTLWGSWELFQIPAGRLP
jgi:cytochrome c-type biogenesis protein CcmH/NrfG